MTRVKEPCINHGEMFAWTKANQEHLEKHPAWHENVDAMKAEHLLVGKESFTYLLRKGEEGKAYFITFVKEDRAIKHQRFTLEYDRKGWYYRNGMHTSGHPTEIISETLADLIPQMMHCSTEDCIIVASH